MPPRCLVVSLQFVVWIPLHNPLLTIGQKYNYSKGNPPEGRILGKEGEARDIRVLSLTISQRLGSVLKKKYISRGLRTSAGEEGDIPRL